MITIETSCTKTISCPIDSIKSIAFDGYDYALLRGNRKTITRLDDAKCPVSTQQTTHCYTSICFDMQECCYYACAIDHPSTLYKLDINFNEIKKTSLASGHDQGPCAMSVHPSKPLLLLLYPNEILYWDICSGTITNVICLNQDKQVLDIVAIYDGYILSYLFENQTYLEVHCSFCEKAQKYRIPNNYQLNAMILMEICCNEQEDDTTYIVQLLLSDCNTQEQVSTTIQIKCNHEQPNPPHPGHLTCEGGKNEIIHSIALEEAGIAHILNAEGEKLQKAVASDITIEELLMVNESVRKTITQITLLEGQLYSKLESLHCLCCDDEQHDDECEN